MSQEVEFLLKVNQDSALKAAVKAAVEKAANKDEEVQAVTQIAKNAGFDVSADGLKAVVERKLQAGELSDDELEKVAGGGAAGDIAGAAGNLVSTTGNAGAAVINSAGAAVDTTVNATVSVVNDVASFFSSW